MRASMRAAALCICLAAALAGCAAFGKCGLRECAADAKISAEVRSLFAQSPALGAPNLISVQTMHRVIYLRGLVSTPRSACRICCQSKTPDKRPAACVSPSP
jgi:hypothetical protein